MNDRFSQFDAALERTDFSPTARALARRALSMLRDWQTASHHFLDWANADSSVSEEVASAVSVALDALRDPISDQSNDGLLKWTRELLQMVRQYMRRYEGGILRSPQEIGEPLMAVERTLEMLEEQVVIEQDAQAMQRELRRNVSEAEEASRRAMKAQENLERASGAAGRTALSTHFSEYAKRELRAATRFRWFSVALVAVAILCAFLIIANPEWRIPRNDWTGFATKFGLLAGVGSLAAFFARQAATHRRSGTWARSVEIQLDSFPAFIDAVPEDGRTAAYLALSQRLLGAPPNKDGETAQEQLSTSQLIELITSAVKKA